MSISFWMDQEKNKEYRTNRKPKKFDIIVIGGGIAGLSAVYWLQKRDPSLSVALLEKGLIGDGATGRNAGFITCGSVEHFNRLVENHGAKKALEIWHFSEENLKLLRAEIINGREKDLFFEQRGSFSLASTENELKELQKSSDLMKNLGIGVEVLDEKQVEKRLGARDFVGGIKYKDDASIHPLLLLGEIREKIKRKTKKVQFFENCEVFEISNVGEDKLIKARGEHFVCPMIVMATNGYSPLLHSFFKDKIFPTRGQILATAPVPLFMEGPCYANFVLDYFRQLPTGELLIGGFRQLQKEKEVGYSDEVTDIIQSALEDFLKKHIPKLRTAPITHRWSGVMGFSVDGQPLVGSLPSDNQVTFLGGFTAHGLGLAFHSGKILSDIIFGNTIPHFISAKRFTSKE